MAPMAFGLPIGNLSILLTSEAAKRPFGGFLLLVVPARSRYDVLFLSPKHNATLKVTTHTWILRHSFPRRHTRLGRWLRRLIRKPEPSKLPARMGTQGPDSIGFLFVVLPSVPFSLYPGRFRGLDARTSHGPSHGPPFIDQVVVWSRGGWEGKGRSSLRSATGGNRGLPSLMVLGRSLIHVCGRDAKLTWTPIGVLSVYLWV